MADYRNFQTIKVEIEDTIAVITLNRPEALNAVDHQMHLEIESVLEKVAEDTSVNVLVLTGAGRAFSAGGDIKAMKARAEVPKAQRDYVNNFIMQGPRKLIRNLLEVQQPIIAALNGDAIGLGATLALFSDIIIASKEARIGDPHVRVGIVAGDGGAAIWPLLTSLSKAKELLLTGDLITASEAERLGLVNKVVLTGEVMSEAMALARRLASGPTLAIRWTKMALNKRLRDQVNLVLDASLATEGLTFISEDHREAVEAFLDKRQPKFRAR
ncbi:MAG: enoyl-CoA hydratase/isomerase family protein [Dehalococcoidia bacterium]